MQMAWTLGDKSQVQVMQNSCVREHLQYDIP
jgi:hypothetical protein